MTILEIYAAILKSKITDPMTVFDEMDLKIKGAIRALKYIRNNIGLIQDGSSTQEWLRRIDKALEEIR